MKVKEIVDTLKYGDLLNISWESDKKLKQIIMFINLGLLDLYGRFPIKEKQIAIQQYPQISTYILDRNFARTNHASKELHKYILDTPFEPFMGDVLQIIGAYDENGHSHLINDDNNPTSWFTPSYDSIQIPNAREEETSFIVYRASPIRLEPEDPDVLDKDVFLPPCLLQPLSSFVAYKVYMALGGQEGGATAQMFQQLYEQQCTDVNTRNLLNNNLSPTNIKPVLRGYV